MIDNEGAQRGITTIAAALELAASLDLDLVEVAPDADPPVCRIMDYGKHRFEQSASERTARRKSASNDLKQMRYTVRIGPADFDTKTRKVAKFIAGGHKVRITIRFRRGREQERVPYARELMGRIADAIDHARVESPPRLDGLQMTMLLAPDASPRAARAPA